MVPTPTRTRSATWMAARRAVLAVALALLVPLATPAAPADAQGDPVCTPIAGAEAILEPAREGAPGAAGRVLLLGEIHGTREAPEAVERIVCAARTRGLPVTVGLEIPTSESSRIEAFFAEPAPASAEQGLDLLLAGPFWQRDYQDGRASEAMLALLVALRRLDAGLGRVRVICFDNAEGAAGRDAAMARKLAADLAAPLDRFVVVLTGNLHNRMTIGTPFDPAMDPMGHLLAAARPDLDIISLNLTHSGGTAWTCINASASDCGARDLRGRDGVAGITIEPETGAPRPYHGTQHLGSITASLPASKPLTQAPGREPTSPTTD